LRLKSCLTAFLLSVVCLVPRAVFADTLTLTSTSGGSTDGVDVYPYNFTVTDASGNQTANVFLSCLNFNREITFGETWVVDPLELSSVDPNATYDGESGASLLEDAWLFNQYGTAAGTDSEINFAIWSIMDPDDINASDPSYNGANAFDATAQALAAQAVAEVTGSNPLPSSYFAIDLAYLPDPSGSATWTDGQPQIFMADPPAETPEPGSLFLLGTGFGALAVGVAATNRRRAAELSTAAAWTSTSASSDEE
jgi:hypothetical protein